ncbi:25426aa1-c760-4bca-a21d-6a7372dfba21 [Thermothielavioides terrestris]|uniref:Secreted protein n=2 Tax=Thermothielavioides terrestris TaxID=2587410 RepID=G2RCT0_THETT|nr:uncharacterized protein THITE_2122346 [Thermothielavioides terrestris NRRL 8126]AEO70676.1 hypothetical protein THITE_2122346 [Thermothielavioides terrestris NRRL 8126]SPQ18493.1 25426aa1-c760-4bca-a21d-6a7372dfba21 [Thermothielavioides terrestris]
MGLLSHLAVFLTAASAVVADPHITSIKFAGSGCPNNPKFSGSFENGCITYSDFVAVQPGYNSTLNCQAQIQAAGANPGWQVALKSNTVKGHAVLSPGASLDYYTTVFFSQDAANTNSLKGTLSNTGSSTLNQDVTLYAEANGGQVWSPCTGSDGYTGILVINFRAALNGDGKARFEADTEEWDLEWRRC